MNKEQIVICKILILVVVVSLVIVLEEMITTDYEECLENTAKEYCVGENCEFVCRSASSKFTVFDLDTREEKILHFSVKEKERCKAQT